MKRLWAAILLLFLLLGASLGNARYARSLTDGMAQQLERAQEAAGRGDWAYASDLSRKAFSCWKEHEFYLHVLMRHSDTDQILLSFQALEEYLALEEPDQYTAANAELITQLELLAEMEQASVKNVL